MSQQHARSADPGEVGERKQSPAESVGGGGPKTLSLDLSTAFQAYRYTFCGVAIGRGMSPADAEDVVQEFFLEATRTGLPEKYDATKGPERPFLTKAFQLFLTKEIAKRRALKRGWGKLVALSIEDDRVVNSQTEGLDLRSPEAVCQAREVTIVLERAVGLLREELNGKAHARTFEALIPFLDSKGKHVCYRTLGTTLGLSAGAARMKLMRLRRRLRAYVFKELEIENPGLANRAASVESLFRCLDP